MPEVVSEPIISVDGFARGTRSPAYYGFFGPEFGGWLKKNSAQPHQMIGHRWFLRIRLACSSSHRHDCRGSDGPLSQVRPRCVVPPFWNFYTHLRAALPWQTQTPNRWQKMLQRLMPSTASTGAVLGFEREIDHRWFLKNRAGCFYRREDRHCKVALSGCLIMSSCYGPLNRQTLRFNPLSDQFLQAPKSAVVNSQGLEVTDGAVEIVSHRAHRTHRRGERISHLLRRKPVEVARPSSIDDEGDRTKRAFFSTDAYPVR